MPVLYNVGDVAVTNGSAIISGAGTAWVSFAKTGDLIVVDGNSWPFSIIAVNSDTSLTVERPYDLSSGSGKAYKIIPIQGRSLDVSDKLATLLSEYQTVKDNAGAGRFAKGSSSFPSIRGINDPDTGVNFEGGNILDWIIGAVRRMRLSSTALQVDVPVTGTSVMQGISDATPGRLLTSGRAFGLGGEVLIELGPNDDLDNLTANGFYYNRAAASTTGNNYPVPSAGFLSNFKDASNRWVQQFIPFAGAADLNSLRIYTRSNGSAGWTPWGKSAVEETDVLFTSVKMRDAVLTGRQLVVADDAVASYAPPRRGGLVSITVNNDDAFPQQLESIVGIFDVGTSLAWNTIFTGVNATVRSNGQDLTSTPGADARVTYSMQSNGVIQINNRSGASRTFTIHVMC